MRELLWWLFALMLTGSSWVGLYEMAAFATHIPVDQPPRAFGVGPMYLLGLAFPLALLSGSWMLAAVIRLLVVIVRAFLRRPTRAEGLDRPLANPSGRGTR